MQIKRKSDTHAPVMLTYEYFSDLTLHLFQKYPRVANFYFDMLSRNY